MSFGYADDMKINFHFSFPRTGSTMFLSYMRANPRIETGYAEPNHLFHLVTKVARWKKQYADLFGADYNACFHPAVKAFIETHYGALMKKTKRDTLVLKHPWLAPYIPEITQGMFPESKVILMHRHPYDTIASAMFQYRNNPKGQKVYKQLGKVVGINDMCDLYIEWWGHLRKAQKALKDRAIVMRYEDLITEPVPWLEKVYDHFGVPLTRPEIEEIVERGQNDGLQMLGGFMHKTKLQFPVTDKWHKWVSGAEKKKVKSKLDFLLSGNGYVSK